MNKPTSSLRNAGSRGLSLIEMMVAVTVLGTLVALAAPSFARIGERYKVDGVQADLVTALQSARAEAVNQGRTVTLRRLAGCPEATHPADWRCGWESFIDRNRNRTRDPDDTLLSNHGPVRGHQILLEGPRDDSLAYSALGRSDVATQGLRITPDRSTTAGTTAGTGLRRLCIEFGGTRLRVVEGTLRSKLVQQTITGQVARTGGTTDFRNFFMTSRNAVLYTTNTATSPRGWYIDLPPTGERLLSNPTLGSGTLVRFNTRVPAESQTEGTCSTTPRPELGFLNIVSGLTGAPSVEPVFHSADPTLDLSNASRVQFGAGESVGIETGRRTVVFDLTSAGASPSDQTRTSPLELNRFTYVPRRIDWRILP